MTAEAMSVTAIIIAAAALLVSLVFAFFRALRIASRLRKTSKSSGFAAATALPAAGARIAAGAQQLQAIGRWKAVVERLAYAHDASDRLREDVDAVAACVVDLLDLFVPSLRGSAP